MKQNTIRKTCQVVPVLLITGALAACDAHIEEPDKTVRPGHVLCVDGKAVPYSEYENSGKQAIAVVFHTYSDGETEGNGYAVYLWDMTPKAFADSLGVEQGTSADIAAYDGNENTFALYDTEETASPMAEAVTTNAAASSKTLRNAPKRRLRKSTMVSARSWLAAKAGTRA